MTKTIRFYNRDGFWFADVPEWILQGGSEEDLAMVAGADIWLDFLSNGKDGIHIEISDDEIFDDKLVLLEKDEFGATYNASSYEEMITNQVLWLCNVTIYIFGKFPETIYYKVK